MIGAIIGDIAGSRFERNNIKHKNFELLAPECRFTDDTVMTLAVAKALNDSNGDYSNLQQTTIKTMRDIGLLYPDCGYGRTFKAWLETGGRSGNSSYGNGAVMRISPVAYYARNLKELDRIAYDVTVVSHNHEYAIKGAHTVARAVYMALHGASKDEIKRFVSTKYDIGFTIDGIRELYQFSAATQDTVAPAVVAFLESNSFEEAIKSVISIGGDSDTLAAVCGAIAGAYYGVDETLEQRATRYLDNRLLKIYEQTKR